MIKTLLSFISLILISSALIAFEPTAEQMEQFQRLPASQQQALAKQYGVDLNSLKGDQPEQPSFEEMFTKHGNQRAKSAADKQQYEDAKRGKKESRGYSYYGRDEYEDLSLEERMFTVLGAKFDETDEDEPKEELKHFGYDLFEHAMDSFTPATDIPIPSRYVMGPGDSIIVQLYGKENASYSFTVNREGIIQFPKIGPVSVIGLNFGDLKDLITDTVNNQMIGVKASITMGALRSIRVFILGDVKYPGSYTVNSLSTMTNALFKSGGINEIGSLRRIQLKRAGKLITTMDLYDLLLRGDTSKDSRLLPGDVIFIPPIGRTVGVRGEVRRPAIYELKWEKTAEQVLRLAGGMLPTAYPQASRIERINKNGNRTVLDVDLKTTQGKRQRIQAADEIQIFSVLETMENVVSVEGHVKRPGIFSWKKNMRFTDVVKNAHDLLPNPDLSSALIIREIQPTRQITVNAINPTLAFTEPETENNPILNEGDRIIIFGFVTDRQELLKEVIESLSLQASKTMRKQLVSVLGHVRFPGEYPLMPNMQVDDLIAMAGG